MEGKGYRTLWNGGEQHKDGSFCGDTTINEKKFIIFSFLSSSSSSSHRLQGVPLLVEQITLFEMTSHGAIWIRDLQEKSLFGGLCVTSTYSEGLFDTVHGETNDGIY